MVKTLLAIETTTTQGSVAIWQDNDAIFSETFVSERNHNSKLFAPLQRALSSIENIDAILVGTGPGSYNGARVAIATAQGIGTIRDIPVMGLCSYLALPTVRCGDEVTICGDARRRAFSLQTAKDGRLTSDIRIVEDEAFITEAAKANQLLTIDNLSQFRRTGVTNIIVEYPTANNLIESWLSLNLIAQKAVKQSIVEPIYVRPPNITPPKDKGTKLHAPASSSAK